MRIAQLLGREREFSANVSHQLRTPLTALRLRLEEIAPLDDPAAVAEEADRALSEADRLERTIADLLAVARGQRRRADRHGRADRARAPPRTEAGGRSYRRLGAGCG